jgi:pimeloyl-ACP methyl ester carboxylesterase
MQWLAEDAMKKNDVTRMMIEEITTDAFLAIRCFKLRRLVYPTVLNDRELQSISVPALFLVGENEKLYSARKAVERLNRVTPQIRAEIIPNAGHDLTIVQAEMVNRKVLEFLKNA